MDDKSLELIERLTRENERLRVMLMTRVQPQPAATGTPAQYMSGRWHRRDGDVYGIVVQSPGVADAN